MLYSLIVPLAYYGDYRPYFTIHDCEVKEYITKTLCPPPIILGVTNPYFSKSLQHWPHIVRVTDTTKKGMLISYIIITIDDSSKNTFKSKKKKTTNPKKSHKILAIKIK